MPRSSRPNCQQYGLHYTSVHACSYLCDSASVGSMTCIYNKLGHCNLLGPSRAGLYCLNLNGALAGLLHRFRVSSIICSCHRPARYAFSFFLFPSIAQFSPALSIKSARHSKLFSVTTISIIYGGAPESPKYETMSILGKLKKTSPNLPEACRHHRAVTGDGSRRPRLRDRCSHRCRCRRPA